MAGLGEKRLNEEDELPIIKKRKVERTMCQYTISSKDTESEDLEKVIRKEFDGESVQVECPICMEMFDSSYIGVHSANCCLSIEKTFDDELLHYQKDDSGEPWLISVVRGKFTQTSEDQLIEADECDWERQIKVKFIGEEGVDHGGLTREFFTLFFKSSNAFNGNSFSLNPNLLENGIYKLVGKAVAMAVCHGHPGPQSLNRYVTDFILTGHIPQFKDAITNDVLGADALAVINEIKNADACNIREVHETHIDMIAATGFSKLLTTENREEAITAIKGYFTLYKIMAPILQFMEGLEFRNVLNLLRKYKAEGRLVLGTSELCSVAAIEKFYLTSFSINTEEKALEEVVMYNFQKFLKRVEREKITTPWINPDENTESIVRLNTGHVLQSLIGSSSLPRTLKSGIITFDHSSNNLSCVNTCAPSITFSDIKAIQEYPKFEEHLLNIIVCSYGFGNV